MSQPMKKSAPRTRTFAVRGALAACVFVLLGGPTPGSVGSCSETSAYVDPVQFCKDRKFWSCQRQWVTGAINDDQLAVCLEPIEATCAGSTWDACDPPPTNRRGKACINALRDMDRVAIPEGDLSECQTAVLCGFESASLSAVAAPGVVGWQQDAVESVAGWDPVEDTALAEPLEAAEGLGMTAEELGVSMEAAR